MNALSGEDSEWERNVPALTEMVIPVVPGLNKPALEQ